MTKHDRLMSALAEIKAICTKNEDYDEGCGKRCSFLMEEDSNGFRGCEVIRYTHQDAVYTIDTPSEWAEERM